MTALARALLEQLEPTDLAALAERLRPYLTPVPAARAAVYSPATLAAELGRTVRSIRAAIARGELHATKQGRSYVISADAVAAWATAPPAAVIQLPPARRQSRPSPGPARRALGSRSQNRPGAAGTADGRAQGGVTP